MDRSHRRYRQLRARVRRDHPLCAHCAAHGLTVAGTDVDHIIPLAHGGRLMDRANLQHLCAACHDAKTQQQHPRRRAGATIHGDLVRPEGGVKVTDEGVTGNRERFGQFLL